MALGNGPPTGGLTPEDLLHFVELSGFTRAWDRDLGLGDADLLALQIQIMSGPKAGPVIPGTGGLRKLRFSGELASRGKRSGVRVCYAYFERYGIILLVAAYSKTQQEDLTPSDKREIRKLLAEIDRYLEQRRRRE